MEIPRGRDWARYRTSLLIPGLWTQPFPPYQGEACKSSPVSPPPVPRLSLHAAVSGLLASLSLLGSLLSPALMLLRSRREPSPHHPTSVCPWTGNRLPLHPPLPWDTHVSGTQVISTSVFQSTLANLSSGHTPAWLLCSFHLLPPSASLHIGP